MQAFHISAAFQNWWLIGTGRGSGQHLDALCDKTPEGLPYVSAKTLKGLFRHSAQCLESWGRIPTGTTASLFGLPPEGELPGEPGALRFSDLQLPTDARQALNARPELKNLLFSEIAATAIDPETGGARDKSLRVSEVAAPIELNGHIHRILPVEQPERLPDWLRAMAALITHIGASKSRGFGEVILRIKTEEPTP